MLILDIFSTVT